MCERQGLSHLVLEEEATLLDVVSSVLYTIGVEMDKYLIKIGIVNYVGELVLLFKLSSVIIMKVIKKQ